jgi:hypothetical protein
MRLSNWIITWMGIAVYVFRLGGCCMAQGVPVPNPSFEKGAGQPVGWTFVGANGSWLEQGWESRRSIAATGNGQDSTYWLSGPVALEANSIYVLRFHARAIDGGGGGTPITSPGFCNRDLGEIPSVWMEFNSTFVTPAQVDPDSTRLRFGQWQRPGTVAFDAIALFAAQPVYFERDGIELGEGERIHGNEYEFRAPYYGESRNCSRPLAHHQCFFNTNRWTFGEGNEVVYRQKVGQRMQTKASIEVNVNYYEGGELVVEVGADGKSWREIGDAREVGLRTFNVPDDLLPANQVWVRLRARSVAEKPDLKPGGFQVDGYTFRATIDGPPVELAGSTRYFCALGADPRVKVIIESLGECVPGGSNFLVLHVQNATSGTLRVSPRLSFLRDDETEAAFAMDFVLEPGENTIRMPYEAPKAGTYVVRIDFGPTIDRLRFETQIRIAYLYDSSYGMRLSQSRGTVTLWTASSGWKIGQGRPVPEATCEAIEVSSAANESEAAQLVVRPEAPLRGFEVRADALAGPEGATIPAERVDVLRVRYVNVAQPTDEVGVAAPWPDPLPPAKGPIELSAGINHPFWIRVNVPANARPGDYAGLLHLSADAFSADVPLHVRVYGFALPARMTCVSAFGFDPGNVFRYQKLADPAQQRAVLEKYWQSFSAHHISPHNPAPLDAFETIWPDVKSPDGGGTKASAETDFAPTFKWDAWDAAMTRAFEVYHFNSFSLPVPGLGGGTFYSRTEPNLLGYSEDTPQYKALFTGYCQGVQEHLRGKGWLDESYVYWFDEPEPRDYAFVMNGFRKLKEAAPDINRMLTEEVQPELIGGPNIWCPVTPNFNPEKSAPRMAAGDRFWWYVCTGPKAPYCTLFIDHPATELRVWLWQTWQRHIEGILVWQSNYWTSDAAYPDHLQNPYEDSMGWTSGYGTPAGTKLPWGNGDGRFIYPPESAADGAQPDPVLEGPVDSIRWEMLRDGIEDYEYMVILRRLLAERGDKATPEKCAAFRDLLEVPANITSSMTAFTTDPRQIESRREAIARAIEALTQL